MGKAPKASLFDKSPKEAKKEWDRETINDSKRKRIQKATAIDPNNPYADDRGMPESVEDKDLADAWKKLIKIAEIKFPKEHAARFCLKPRQRLVGIAKVQGWSTDQISKASGLSRSAICNYLRDPILQEFQSAFEYFLGKRDGRELLEQEIYSSIQVLKDLRDNPHTPASVRQSVSQWFWEQKYGKSKEFKEVKHESIKELTKQLMEHSRAPLHAVSDDAEGEEEWLQ